MQQPFHDWSVSVQGFLWSDKLRKKQQGLNSRETYIAFNVVSLIDLYTHLLSTAVSTCLAGVCGHHSRVCAGAVNAWWRRRWPLVYASVGQDGGLLVAASQREEKITMNFRVVSVQLCDLTFTLVLWLFLVRSSKIYHLCLKLKGIWNQRKYKTYIFIYLMESSRKQWRRCVWISLFLLSPPIPSSSSFISYAPPPPPSSNRLGAEWSLIICISYIYSVYFSCSSFSVILPSSLLLPFPNIFHYHPLPALSSSRVDIIIFNHLYFICLFCLFLLVVTLFYPSLLFLSTSSCFSHIFSSSSFSFFERVRNNYS